MGLRIKVTQTSFAWAIIPTLFLISGCHDEKPPAKHLPFGDLKRVEIQGYTGHAMEPFLSPDGNILLFNNLNGPPENTNLHWATRIDDFTFQYKGELAGVNTAYLEGVPTLDQAGVLYFVSLQSYDQTLSSIYSGTFSNGQVSGVSLVSGISKNVPGWLNFDVGVDYTGGILYLVDGRFDSNGGPYEANIFIAQKAAGGFERSNVNYLQNINTTELEYAPCVSRDNLELFFTRLATPISATSQPQIYVSARERTDAAFGIPVKIEAASGFVEAPTLSPDGNRLYFHKSENGRFVIYTLNRTGL